MEELAKLQDDVPAEPFDKVRPTIESDIGNIDEKFDELETKELSGASLGQVYRGKINGQAVVLKVKRPGIEKMVDDEIEVLKKILPIGMRFVDKNLRFSVDGMLAQFIETIHEEMDYKKESDNLKTISENIKEYENVLVPKVYDDYTTKNVITMEYIPGIKITDIPSLDKAGLDREKLVIDVHKVFFTMLLRHAVFHADPHPGNISVANDGKLILYDFGMVGRIDGDTRMRLIRLYLALVEKDARRTVTAMSDLGMLTPDYNRTVIEKAIKMTVQALHGRKPEEMEVQALMELANKTMSRFPFMLPKNLALYMRMTSIIEGIYHTHKVNFKFVRVLKQILEEEHLIKDAYIEEIKQSFTNFAESIQDAITIAPEIKKFMDHARGFQEKNRPRPITLLAGSILASAVFLGSAILYSSNEAAGTAGMIGAFVIFGMAVFSRNRK